MEKMLYVLLFAFFLFFFFFFFSTAAYFHLGGRFGFVVVVVVFFLSLSLSKRPCGHVITSKKLGCLKREISRRLSREGVDLRTYVGKILWMRR